MLTPKEIYENRKRVQLTANDIYSILDIGLFLSFNNDKDKNYEFIVNRNNHILELSSIERNRVPCSCNHFHYITLDNVIINEIPSLNTEYINDDVDKIIKFITSNDISGTSDYLVINPIYNIGNNIINFGCPICGRSFSLLPNKIDGFDELSFYKNYDNGRYANIFYQNLYNDINFMQVLLETVAHKRLLTIPNVTGVIELSPNNIGLLGDMNYESFNKSYINQISIYK